MAESDRPAGGVTTGAQPKPTKSNPIPEPDHDRVVMASRRPDGTAAQTADFEFIGDKDTVSAAAAEQLAQQAVSATDVAMRGAVAPGGAGGDEDGPDAAVAPLVEAHEQAAGAAKAKAKAEVDEHHRGVGA